MLHQKMSSQILSLAWDGHYKTLVSVFGKLLESSNLVDCTIVAEGQKLKAHKEILSAFSPYFELLFKEETENNPTVILSGINFKDLKCLIDFMYQGKLNISDDKLENLIDVAECLRIKGLGGAHREEGSVNADNTSILHKKCKLMSGKPHKQTKKVGDPIVSAVKTKITLCHAELHVKDKPSAEAVTLLSESQVRTENSECLPTMLQSAGAPSVSAGKLLVKEIEKSQSDSSDAASSCTEDEEESAFLKQLLDALSAETDGGRETKPAIGVKPGLRAKAAEPLVPPVNRAAPASLTSPLRQRDSSGPSGTDSATRSTLVEKQHRCRHCGKMFRYMSNLKFHLRTHASEHSNRQHKNNSGTVINTSTDSSKIQRSDQSQHQIFHERNKPYKCKKCDFQSIYRSTLKKHQITHSESKS